DHIVARAVSKCRVPSSIREGGCDNLGANERAARNLRQATSHDGEVGLAEDRSGDKDQLAQKASAEKELYSHKSLLPHRGRKSKNANVKVGVTITTRSSALQSTAKYRCAYILQLKHLCVMAAYSAPSRISHELSLCFTSLNVTLPSM